MKKLLTALAVAMPLLLAGAIAHAKDDHDHHSDKEIKADIERHRAMAAAHEAAAKCLESGKGHDACQKELQANCKGLAVGKFCGMRHVH
ncbi:MAG: hypothetical protein QM569_06305 [Acidovorax sp.]|uniref:hypothetical protein n=1 Tax=Acidovorax sp. TaxID=1872122 RepID=UPI0039E4D565